MSEQMSNLAELSHAKKDDLIFEIDKNFTVIKIGPEGKIVGVVSKLDLTSA